SGEGVIFAVRDPIWVTRAEKSGEETKEKSFMEDAGTQDKRLLITEEEFAGVLKMCQREGNVLSNILRCAWDGADLGTLTRNPLRATAPHISIIGHTTQADLLRYMTETESANGFGNRFLWCSVKRSKLLPDGGFPDESVLMPLRERLNEAVAYGASAGE